MTLEQLKEKYEIVGTIDLGQWTDDYQLSSEWLRKQCQQVYQMEYSENQRIVFLHSFDYYVKNTDSAGLILKNLQVVLNETDISNYFVMVCSTNPNIEKEMQITASQSTDPVPVNFFSMSGEFDRRELDQHPYSRKEQYQYGSANPIKISLNDISERDKFLLSESKTFCMYPWIHLHAWPTGQAFPCCHAESPAGELGNSRQQTLADIWNSPKQRQLRTDMLSETTNSACVRCYEQEK
jgi:radical SAM protein with 4Fe4S-binding SPASM domain